MSRSDVVRGHGLGIGVPEGWDVRISGPADPGGGPAPAGSNPSSDRTVLHAASFPLPEERGAYGGGAVEQMGGGDVLLCLIEFEPASVDTPLFEAPGVPQLAPQDFRPETMQRPLAGQSGVQRFFNESARAFCLYVVLGSHRARHELVPVVNGVLATIEVSD